jgi:C-terminal processing protease CtpA/Prc
MRKYIILAIIALLLLCTLNVKGADVRNKLRHRSSKSRPPRGTAEISAGGNPARENPSVGQDDAAQIESVADNEVTGSTASAGSTATAEGSTASAGSTATAEGSTATAKGSTANENVPTEPHDDVPETTGPAASQTANATGPAASQTANATGPAASQTANATGTDSRNEDKQTGTATNATKPISGKNITTIIPTLDDVLNKTDGDSNNSSINGTQTDLGNSTSGQINITESNVGKINIIKNVTLELDPYTLGMDFEAKMIDGKRKVVVLNVEKGSDADIAKLEPGDIILALNGRYLNETSNATLSDFIFAQIRDGFYAKRMSARTMKPDKTLKTTTFPVQQGWAAYGITFMIEPDSKYICNDTVNELIIANVAPGSPADKKGLTPGDLVIAINHIKTNGMPLKKAGNVTKGTTSLHLVTVDKDHFTCENVMKIQKVAKQLLRKKAMKTLDRILKDLAEDKVDPVYALKYAKWVSGRFSEKNKKSNSGNSTNDVCNTPSCLAELKLVQNLIKKVNHVATPMTPWIKQPEEPIHEEKCEILKKQCEADKLNKISEEKICGSDHTTYNRECEFLVKQCEERATGSDITIAYKGECKACRDVTLKKTKADHDKGFAFFGVQFKVALLDMGCGNFPRVLKVKENSPASRIAIAPEMNEIVTRINGDSLCDFTVADLKNELKALKEEVTLQLCVEPKNKTESKICKVCPKPEFPGCKFARIDRPFTPWGMNLKLRKTKPFFEISSVVEESPSFKAGARRGDIVLKIDEEDMTAVNEKDILFATVLNAGKKMQMEVRRMGKVVTVDFQRNLTTFSSGLVDGLKFSNQPMLCAGFPTISKIEPHTQAQKLGLAENDVIFSINNIGFCNQEVAESGVDFSAKMALNVQVCKLNKMSRALKFKMCRDYCPAVEGPSSSNSDGETGPSEGKGEGKESSSGSSGPGSSSGSTGSDANAADATPNNDGYVVRQEILLKGFTLAQTEAVVPGIKKYVAKQFKVTERYIKIKLNESEIPAEDDSTNFIEMGKTVAVVTIQVNVFIAGKNTTHARHINSAMNSAKYEDSTVKELARLLNVSPELISLNMETAKTSTVTVTYDENGNIAKIEQNDDDKIPDSNSTKLANDVPPVIKESDNATSPPAPAIEKLNATKTPFIEILFRKRLRFGINFAAAVTKGLRFFEVRKVSKRVKNINLVKYGDVLDKINFKRVDEFGDDGTMDRVLMEANKAILDMERTEENGLKRILSINVTKVDTEPITPEDAYLTTKCGDFPIIKSLTARVRNTPFEKLKGQIITVVNGNHVCRLTKERVDALLYEPIDVVAEVLPAEFASENEDNEFCKHLDCYRPPAPPLPFHPKYEVCKLGYYCKQGKCPEGTKKIEDYCAFMPTQHDEYLSTSHICIPGHYCPPKHQCPVGFELYNANEKGFCFDIQPMGPYTAPNYVGKDALWMNKPNVIPGFYNHTHNINKTSAAKQ